MTFVDRAIDSIIAVEGGYVNHPDDRGGPTRYGVTQATARANGYAGDMKELPLSFAKDLYRRMYWAAPGFDKVAEVSEPVAAWLLDCGVNMGPAVSGAMMQRSLNALSRDGKDYQVISVDGKCGPITVSTLKPERQGSFCR